MKRAIDLKSDPLAAGLPLVVTAAVLAVGLSGLPGVPTEAGGLQAGAWGLFVCIVGLLPALMGPSRRLVAAKADLPSAPEHDRGRTETYGALALRPASLLRRGFP